MDPNNVLSGLCWVDGRFDDAMGAAPPPLIQDCTCLGESFHLPKHGGRISWLQIRALDVA
jgi:hypothetical protein